MTFILECSKFWKKSKKRITPYLFWTKLNWSISKNVTCFFIFVFTSSVFIKQVEIFDMYLVVDIIDFWEHNLNLNLNLMRHFVNIKYDRWTMINSKWRKKMPRMASIFLKNAQYDKNFPDLVFSVKTGQCETWRWHYIIWFKSRRATGTVPFFKTFFLFVQQSRLETLKSKTCELKHTRGHPYITSAYSWPFWTPPSHSPTL